MDSQLLHGDCYELLPTLPKSCIQTAFIDPPYNIGVNYGDGAQHDRLPADEYLRRMERLARACVRLLKPTGGLWLLCPEYLADPIGTMLTTLLPRRNRIIWREPSGNTAKIASRAGIATCSGTSSTSNGLPSSQTRFE